MNCGLNKIRLNISEIENKMIVVSSTPEIANGVCKFQRNLICLINSIECLFL